MNKDHSVVAGYIQILRDTGILRFLLANRQGHALIRNAEKIYIDNSNLLYALNDEVGKNPLVGVMRELFVIGSLQSAGYHVFSSDNGDIEVDSKTFEIGGKNKDHKQIKNILESYLIKDDILSGGSRTIPLYLFGFLS